MFPALLLLKVTPTAQSCSPNLLPKPAPQSCSPKRSPKLISKLLRTVTLPRYYSYPWNCLWKQLPKIIFLKFLPKIIIFQSFGHQCCCEAANCSPQLFPKAALQNYYRKPCPKKAPQNSAHRLRKQMPYTVEGCSKRTILQRYILEKTQN